MIFLLIIFKYCISKVMFNIFNINFNILHFISKKKHLHLLNQIKKTFMLRFKNHFLGRHFFYEKKKHNPNMLNYHFFKSITLMLYKNYYHSR